MGSPSECFPLAFSECWGTRRALNHRSCCKQHCKKGFYKYSCSSLFIGEWGGWLISSQTFKLLGKGEQHESSVWSIHLWIYHLQLHEEPVLAHSRLAPITPSATRTFPTSPSRTFPTVSHHHLGSSCLRSQLAIEKCYLPRLNESQGQDFMFFSTNIID